MTEAGRRILELVYAGFYVARCRISGEWVVTLGRSDREPLITCRGPDIGAVADEALAALGKVL